MFQITIKPQSPKQLEMLAALISSVLHEGLQIGENELFAYARDEELSDPEIREVFNSWQAEFGFEKSIKELPRINWNEEWENNFDPVVIEDILTIKAIFHNIVPQTKDVITIQPKMSFGTGHHATTWMMVKSMSMLRVEGKKILDAGTGTGILAILALMWKASHVVGFDNDEWSYQNATENLSENLSENISSVQHAHIEFYNSSLSDMADNDFDIILANINRNFLLDEAEKMASKLNNNGFLVISGFYDVDSKMLLDRFHTLNLVAQYLLIRETWACIVLFRIV